MGGGGGEAAESSAAPRPSFMSVFEHADGVDVALMVLGLVGAVGDGMSTPATLLISSRITNEFGRGPVQLHQFTSRINENARNIVLLACASWVMAFLEGYCWARTAERQASRMRARYLRAVLRQDVEYFDLRAAGSASDAVAGVSGDSHGVQDALAEKLPSFLASAAMFAGSYAAGLAVLWRLAAAALPSLLLLVVPGIMYGRVLAGLAHSHQVPGTKGSRDGIEERGTPFLVDFYRAGTLAFPRSRSRNGVPGTRNAASSRVPGDYGLARRARAQYAGPAAAVAQQAVSSARTVQAFAAEAATVARFSAALRESARIGLRMGLAKGVTVGSNAVTFAIWAFNVWYGSRLVMYHGYPGGTVFAVSSIIVHGGLALGNALSNLKYLSEASAAAERIQEVIRRVPKIDSGSDAGEELADMAGEVEFRSVAFCYPSRPESPVLVNFSLRVPAGRTVALVGGSGSGKSTAIALLERFYDPSAGAVALDGVDIRRLRLGWLRAQMGLVSQEPALFAMSIRDNLLFGKEDATAEVDAAARAANAHGFIAQLPRGYDTQVDR
ncbi:unnamed protein product [Urochloa humidicola]